MKSGVVPLNVLLQKDIFNAKVGPRERCLEDTRETVPLLILLLHSVPYKLKLLLKAPIKVLLVLFELSLLAPDVVLGGPESAPARPQSLLDPLIAIYVLFHFFILAQVARGIV